VLLFKVLHGFVDIDRIIAVLCLMYSLTGPLGVTIFIFIKIILMLMLANFIFVIVLIDVWNNCLSAYQVHLPSVNAFERLLAHVVF